MGEDYIGEPELTLIESLDGGEYVRILDYANNVRYSANTDIDTLSDYVVRDHGVSELNDFATLSNSTNTNKTVVDGLNTLLGHFQIRTFNGSTDANGKLKDVMFSKDNEIIIGCMAACGTTECRAYAYTSGGNQYIQLTNRLATVPAALKSKSVTVTVLLFKIDLTKS